MESKRAKVIMLPTEDKTDVIINTYINSTHNRSPIQTIEEATRLHLDNIKLSITQRGYQYQHLYFTTDEEPKNGDYYLCPKNLIRKCRTSFEIGGRKIVATTDNLATGTVKTFHDKRGFTEQYLPQPSQAFIEKYCELGGIDEVFIEYETYEQFDGTLLPGHTYPKKTTLKVDSHNTISIRPVKNSWSREEVEAIRLESFEAGLMLTQDNWEEEDWKNFEQLNNNLPL